MTVFANPDSVVTIDTHYIHPQRAAAYLIVDDGKAAFVDNNTVFAQDPTWNWGTGARNPNGNITEAIPGDLWYPHVYMVVSNPYDPSGVNPFGKWFYGPWFNPPTPVSNRPPVTRRWWTRLVTGPFEAFGSSLVLSSVRVPYFPRRQRSVIFAASVNGLP